MTQMIRLRQLQYNSKTIDFFLILDIRKFFSNY